MLFVTGLAILGRPLAPGLTKFGPAFVDELCGEMWDAVLNGKFTVSKGKWKDLR